MDIAKQLAQVETMATDKGSLVWELTKRTTEPSLPSQPLPPPPKKPMRDVWGSNQMSSFM